MVYYSFSTSNIKKVVHQERATIKHLLHNQDSLNVKHYQGQTDNYVHLLLYYDILTRLYTIKQYKNNIL